MLKFLTFVEKYGTINFVYRKRTIVLYYIEKKMEEIYKIANEINFKRGFAK